MVAAGHYAVQRFGPKVDSEPLLAVEQKNQTKKFVQDALIKAKSPKNKNQKRMKNGCAKGRCWIPIARPLPVVLLMLCCGGCLADHPKPLFSSGNSSSANLSFGTSDFGLLDAFNYSCQPCRPHYLHVGQGGCGILFDCHSENGHNYFYDYSRFGLWLDYRNTFASNLPNRAAKFINRMGKIGKQHNYKTSMHHSFHVAVAGRQISKCRRITQRCRAIASRHHATARRNMSRHYIAQGRKRPKRSKPTKTRLQQVDCIPLAFPWVPCRYEADTKVYTNSWPAMLRDPFYHLAIGMHTNIRSSIQHTAPQPLRRTSSTGHRVQIHFYQVNFTDGQVVVSTSYQKKAVGKTTKQFLTC